MALKKLHNIGELNLVGYVQTLGETDGSSLVPNEKYNDEIKVNCKFTEDRFGKFTEDRFTEELKVKITLRYRKCIMANKAKICIDGTNYYVLEVNHEAKRFTHLICKKG